MQEHGASLVEKMSFTISQYSCNSKIVAYDMQLHKTSHPKKIKSSASNPSFHKCLHHQVNSYLLAHAPYDDVVFSPSKFFSVISRRSTNYQQQVHHLFSRASLPQVSKSRRRTVHTPILPKGLGQKYSMKVYGFHLLALVQGHQPSYLTPLQKLNPFKDHDLAYNHKTSTMICVLSILLQQGFSCKFLPLLYV